jgi:NAD(P)-dependent dehydrogenase (short-subunit alcohol dehydrogenase family)
LTDRGVAIVTGGAFGIGLAIAEALLTDGWKLILADLAQGPLDTARARLDARRTQGGGAIVNIASVSGQRGRSAYGASKGGVITLTQVMACELAPENIRVNAMSRPGRHTPLVHAVHNDAIRVADEIAGAARAATQFALAGAEG